MLKVIVPHITIFQLLHHSLQFVVFKHLCIEMSKILGCVSMIFIFVYNVTNTQRQPFYEEENRVVYIALYGSGLPSNFSQLQLPVGSQRWLWIPPCLSKVISDST